MTDEQAVADGPRASKTRVGRPSSPTPWMIWGMGRAWAWGSHGGLLELTDIGDKRIVRLSSSSLDPKGAHLRFERRVRGLAPEGDEYIEHDLLTGRQTVEAPTSLTRAHGPNGEVLDVTVTVSGSGHSTHSKYVITQKRSVIELPVDERFGHNQTGPAAQFTSDGRHLALSHQTPDRQISGVTTVDLVDNQVERFDGVELVGSGCWSPDGSRLLVASSPGGYPEVLDTRLGSLTRLDTVIENPRNTPLVDSRRVDQRHQSPCLSRRGNTHALHRRGRGIGEVSRPPQRCAAGAEERDQRRLHGAIRRPRLHWFAGTPTSALTKTQPRRMADRLSTLGGANDTLTECAGYVVRALVGKLIVEDLPGSGKAGTNCRGPLSED
nr:MULTISPECIES: hypothetical protein [unclassified Frigoribacterium]